MSKKCLLHWVGRDGLGVLPEPDERVPQVRLAQQLLRVLAHERLPELDRREGPDAGVDEDGVEQVRVDAVEDAGEGHEVDRGRHQRDEEVERHLREGRHVLRQALVRVVDVALELDLVVGLVAVVLARELRRHPLAPVEREPLALELVEHGERRRHGEADGVVERLLREDRLVLGAQSAVEVAADEAEDDRDAALREDEREEQAELELRAVGLLEVGRRQPPEEAQPLPHGDVRGLDDRIVAVAREEHRRARREGAAPCNRDGGARRRDAAPRRRDESQRWDADGQ